MVIRLNLDQILWQALKGTDIRRVLTFGDRTAVCHLQPRERHVIRAGFEAIRQRADCQVRVVVGGAAFDEAPDLWEKVGGDGYAATIEDARKVGARLVGLPDA